MQKILHILSNISAQTYKHIYMYIAQTYKNLSNTQLYYQTCIIKAVVLYKISFEFDIFTSS